MLRKARAAQSLMRRLARIPQQLEHLRLAVGRLEMRQTAEQQSFHKSEFQVYSQWGEDGLIQHLVRRVPIERPVFVEFGVEDYLEANTRFLLQHQNWFGLVLDGSRRNIEMIKQDAVYWRHSIKAVSAFINASNINVLLQDNGVTGDIGLLSIDIDGNDYWVWRAVDVISPRIVICEYNGLFGPRAAVTVPYDPGFVRSRAHYSCLLAGASLTALAHLGKQKGYRLVGINSAGNNAFFVRDDVAGALPVEAPESVYVEPRFREARNRDGRLLLLGIEEARMLIARSEVVDVVTNERVCVGDLCL